jgi:hypothetical protein
VNGEELLLADQWTVRYVATLPREHPQLYDPARPELALPHTVELAWWPLHRAFAWTLPPGVDCVHLPLAEDVREAWLIVDGKSWPVGADGVVELDPLPSPARQAWLRVGAGRETRAVITGPVTYRFEEGILAAWWWYAQGLRWYVGAVRMRQTFRLDGELSSNAVLDLGHVKAVASVEAQLNGNSLNERIARPPFHFDLAGHLRRGDNELELLVRNTPGTDCGVFGPVTIRRRRSPDSSSKT